MFEANCDDAAVAQTHGATYLDFDREAGSPQDAILSAIHDIRRARASIRVSHVEPGDLVTAAEMARRLGCSREYVRLLAQGDRGTGDFPAPVSGVTTKTAIWSWCDVLRWMSSQGSLVEPTELAAAEVIRDVNAAMRQVRDPAASRRRDALSRRLRRAGVSRSAS